MNKVSISAVAFADVNVAKHKNLTDRANDEEIKFISTEIVFIDSQVSAVAELVAGVREGIETFVIEPTTDGIEQINRVLAQYDRRINKVHLVSHGTPGCLYLGDGELSLATLGRYKTQLQQWNIDSLLVYGCRVAAGDAGAEFIAELETLTKAEIAASTTLTGNAVLGGNWQFEVKGDRKTALAFRAETIANYRGILQNPFKVTNTNDSGDGSLRQVISTAEKNNNGSTKDIIDLSAITGTIFLNSSLPNISESVEIKGNDVTIDGRGSHQIFSVYGETNNTQIVFSDLNLTGGKAKGGDGSNGGGGGLGAGGALFINQGKAIVDDVNFSNNNAQGGNGAESASGGNSGIRGGRSGIPGETGGTGGGLNGGVGASGGAGGSGGNRGSGGAGGAGGAAGVDGFGKGGGGGGGGGGGDRSKSKDRNYPGGNGGIGGIGGFGAGGGAGGKGGIGSGNGNSGVGGAGGEHGGNGGNGGNGGGGAGLGGAVFVNSGADLFLLNSDFANNNSTTAGTGFQDGKAWGGDIFVRNGANVSAANTTIGSGYTKKYGEVNFTSLPNLSISSNGNPSEPSNSSSFNLNLDKSLPVDFTVNYSVGGTATNADYKNLISKKIPAGNTSGSIDLEIADDKIYDPNETVIVTLQDSKYYNLSSSSSATATIIDDEPNISVTKVNDATEGGDLGEFRFNLSPAAPANRSLSFKVAGNADPNKADLNKDYRILKADGSVLNPDGNGNFSLNIGNQSQVTVQVDAKGNAALNQDFDDNIDEPNETVQITLNPSNEYGGGGSKATLNIIDNDDPPTVDVVAGNNPTEDKETPGYFNLNFDSAVLDGGAIFNYAIGSTDNNNPNDNNPSDYNLEILYSKDNSKDNPITPSNNSFTLPKGTTSAKVKIEPIDDKILDPDETVTFTLEDGSGYVVGSNTSASLTIIDNEVLPVASISTDTSSAEEGELLRFAVALNSPALSGGASVSYTVAGTATDGTDFTSVGGAALVPKGKQQVFIPVQTIDDLIAEGAETIQISLTADGSGYGLGSTTQATISLTDNDTAGIKITPVSGSTTEAGGQAVFEAVLNSEPTDGVTLNLASSDTDEGTVNPAAVVFNPSNWNQPQTFSVTGVDDAAEDGNQAYTIQTAAISNDTNYNNINVEDVAVTNVDDDSYAVLITPSQGSTNIIEGGAADSYDLALSKAPTGDVEITVTADAQSEISLNGVDFRNSLTVTRSDTEAQTIQVRAKDDAEVEGTHTSTITHQISGVVVDTNYSANLDIADVAVQIADNDIPIVSVASISNASEQSVVPGEFKLVLDAAAPTGGITVNYSVDNQSTATAADYQPLSGSVYIAEGNTGATVSLIPVQDPITENPAETVVIDLTANTGYQLGTNATGTLQITDDDVAGVRISESGNKTDLVEGQKSDTYSVRLTSKPASDVTIGFNVDSQIQNIQPLTFTQGNWNQPQTVTVNSVDDDSANGDRTSTISHTINSSDSNYTGVAIDSVTANIADNDIAGIEVTNTNNLQVTEGDTFSYNIALATKPTADVTIDFSTSNDLGSVTPLTFTANNWDTPQAVEIAAIVDKQVEDVEIQNITHSLTSSDAAYNNLVVEDVRVAINELSFDPTETAGGLAQSLGSIQNSVDAQLAAIELPFVGSLNNLAPDLIGDFKDVLVNAVQTAGSLNIEDLSDLLEDKIESALNLDVDINAALSADEATFDLTIGKEYELASIDLDADLGLPGLGIEVDGDADLTFEYELGLGFGISQEFGFFVDTDKTGFEAEVSLGLSDKFKAGGELGFLALDIENDEDSPTAATVSFELGINDTDNGAGIKIFDADGDRQLDDNEPSTKVAANGTSDDLIPQAGDPLDANNNSVFDEEEFKKNEGVYATTTKKINGSRKDVYFFDRDRDGRLDTNEPFVTYNDGNNNNQLDDGELSHSQVDENDQFKLKKTKTGAPKVYFDKNNNNTLDASEEIDRKFDRNGNLLLDPDETIEGEGVYQQGLGVAFLDQNNNQLLDNNEPYVNSAFDALTVDEEKVLKIITVNGETFIDVDGDGAKGDDDTDTDASNAGITFLDLNDNQEYDEGGDDEDIKVVTDNGERFLDFDDDNFADDVELKSNSPDDPLELDDDKISTATVDGEEVSYLNMDLDPKLTEGDAKILIVDGVRFLDLDGDEEAGDSEPQAKPNNDFSELDRTQTGDYIEILDDGDRLTISEIGKSSPSDLFEISLDANANLGLSAVTSIEGDTAFPSIAFDLAGEFPILSYEDGEVTGPQKPTLAFNEVKLDLGSFLTDFMEPVIGAVDDVIDPFRPIVEFLNEDTKLFGEIGLTSLFDANSDGKVNVLELAIKISELAGAKPNAKYIKFFDAVVEISELVESLNKLAEGGDNIVIDLGSYELGSTFDASDADADAASAETTATETAPTLDQQLDSTPNTGAKQTQKNITKNLTARGGDFNIPLISDPSTAIDLLLGKDVPLFTYDLPRLEVGFEVEREFRIWGPVSGLLEGDFNVGVDLAFGFDTYGFRQWQQVVDFDPLESYRVLDGFYVSDRENPDGTGKDVDELTASAVIAAGLGLDVAVASGYVKGGIEGLIGIDFVDGGEVNGSDDGRLRASEIIDRITTPWELFQLSGQVNAFLGAEIKAGIGPFKKTVWEKRFATFQLAEFTVGPKGTSASSALDGAIAGGKVFFDADFDLAHDPSEPFTFTNADGSYDLEVPLYQYDLNTNGEIDPEEGKVVIVDGIDTSTYLVQTAAIFTTPDATVATPLTSLATQIAEPDFAASQTTVINRFNLAANSNLYSYDPTEADLNLFATQTELQNLVVLATQKISTTAFVGKTIDGKEVLAQNGSIYLDRNDNDLFDEDDLEISLNEDGTRYFDVNGNETLDSGELSSPINEADIATAILNGIVTRINNGTTPDLSDSATVEAIINEAVTTLNNEDAQTTLDNADITALAATIVEKNNTVENIVGNSFLTETQQRQQIVSQWTFIDTNDNGTLDNNEPFSIISGDGTNSLDIQPFDSNDNGELDQRVTVTGNSPEWKFFDTNANGTFDENEPFSVMRPSGDSDLEINFLDNNENGVQDNNEPFEIVHSFGKTEIAIAPFDTNNDGVLDPDERANLILDGTALNKWSYVDSNNNQEFDRDELFSVVFSDGSDKLDPYVEGKQIIVDGAESPELAAGFQHLAMNPLGTVSRLLAEAVDTDAAQQKVKTALGIPDVDLLNYDPLNAIANNQANGLEIYAKQVQVQNTLSQFKALGANEQVVLDNIIGKIDNNQAIDLSDSTQLQTIIQEVLPSVDANVQQGAAQVITEANQRIDDIVENGTGSGTEKAIDIVQVQTIAQGETTEDLRQLGKGEKPLAEVINENTGQQLTQQIDNVDAEDPTQVPDLDAVFPVAEPDSATTDVNESVYIEVIANDSSSDGYLTITDTSNAAHGTVQSDGDYGITYTPNTGFVGEDAFFYSIKDFNGNAASTFVMVKVGINEIEINSGDETITGTNQSDDIIGNSGRNVISSLDSADRFIYDSWRDRGDVLTDFTVGEDKIVMTDLLDNFNYRGSDPIADGYIQFGSRGDDAVLLIDSDGLAGSNRAQTFLTVEDTLISDLNNPNNFEF